MSVREIVACILELYKRHGSQHQWLASGGNFHNALCEFLRTRDCFLDTPPHPVVKVSFSASLSSQGEPNVVGILARFGPLVGFNRLDTYTTEDAWCHIHPKHMEPVLDPAYPSLLGRPEYRLASDWIKFTWENDDEGFHGYVRPMTCFPQDLSTQLNVDLVAISKRFFPQGVVFERNVRIRITLSVLRVSNIPTASPSETMLALQRCKERRSLFSTPRRCQDLGKVMKANKRAAAPSPTKPLTHAGDVKQYIQSLPESIGPNGMSPLMANPLQEKSVWSTPSPTEKPWGKNVPAWSTILDHCADPHEALFDVYDRTDLYQCTPDLHEPQDIKGKEKLRSPEHLPEERFDLRPCTSLRRKIRSDSSLLTAKDTHSKTSVDEYVVIQPPHTTPSPQNSSESNVPLEMKRISQSSIRTPCNKIIHYPGVSTSPKAPNGYSLCPASAPPARRRADSVLGISMPIRPSSATRTWTDNTIDGTGNSSGLFGTTDDDHQYESCPTWVVWANNDAGGGKHCVLEQARKGKLTPPSDVTAERMRSKLEEIQEILQTDEMKRMKEWYDAMVLKQDTPCKKTREELSEEEAYGRLFLGGDSGEEADVDEA